MPYIKQEARDNINRRDDLKARPMSAGELNFVITQMIIAYIVDKELSYQTINDIIGALEGAKLEFYRRVVVSYENEKIKDNGDVYPARLTPLP